MTEIPVSVAYALSEQQWLLELPMPQGSTVADLLERAATQAPFNKLPLASVSVGVYGEVVSRDRVLEPFDRVEIYRSLQVDPKTARRQRAAESGAVSRPDSDSGSASGAAEAGR